MLKPIFIALLCVVLCACETPLDFQNPESYTPSLVITDYFTPDSIWSFRVSRSIALSQPAFPLELFIENATVFIQGASGYQEELIHSGRGVYRSGSGVYPEIAEMYTIEVESSGYESIRATSHAPQLKSELLGIQTVDSMLFGQVYIPTHRLRLRVTDLPGKSYYRLRIVQAVPACYNEESGLTRIDPNSDRFEYRLDSFASSTSSFFPDALSLDEPPNPLYGDINIRFRNAYFSDRFFQNTEQEFELFFQPFPLTDDVSKHFMLILSALSEEVVLYERSEFLQIEYLENNDYLFTTPVELHSNIEGGLGIFAGYTSDTYRIDSDGKEWQESDLGIGEQPLPICQP